MKQYNKLKIILILIICKMDDIIIFLEGHMFMHVSLFLVWY